MKRIARTAIVLTLGTALLGQPANASDTCSGEFLKTGGYYSIGGCNLSESTADEVLKVCALGQQCEVTGTLEHCKGIRGACAKITHVTTAHWGKPLPVCEPSAAFARANQWWSVNSSVLIRDTIAQNKEGDGSAPPYGHTKIVMDLTTFSDGAPMPVDRVPEKWIGRYVERSGIAMKSVKGWYIIARSIKDVAE